MLCICRNLCKVSYLISAVGENFTLMLFEVQTVICVQTGCGSRKVWNGRKSESKGVITRQEILWNFIVYRVSS